MAVFDTSIMDEKQEQIFERALHNLQYHRPESELTQQAMGEIREASQVFLHTVCSIVPSGRELSMSVTDIENACMQAIAGLARNEGVFLDSIS